MERFKRLNWLRVGIALLILIILGSLVFSLVHKKSNDVKGKDVSVESIEKSLKDKSASTQKQGTNTAPKSATPNTLGGSSDGSVTPPTTSKPTPATPKTGSNGQKLANSGPGTTALLLFTVTAIAATLYQYRRRVFILANQQ
ncbi:MAG: hypothetical protein QFB86_01380 [Patescibacteria group bacterium]|nr:hypothetical protein [Patescibacteria group bacterium]